MNLTEGDLKQKNGCRIGVAEGSYQKELLGKWLDSNQIQAETVVCKGYDEMIEKLDADELDALVIPVLSVNSDFIAIKRGDGAISANDFNQARRGLSNIKMRGIRNRRRLSKGVHVCFLHGSTV